MIPEINERLERQGLDTVSAILTPVPTSPGWTAHYELPLPAIAITTETNRRLEEEKRLQAQGIYLDVILNAMGFTLTRVENPDG